MLLFCLIIFLATCYLLILKSGKTFPILYLFLFGYFLQYIGSTYLIYNQFPMLAAWMPIKQEQYFSYAIPALGSLLLGVFLFNRDFDIRKLLDMIDPVEASNLGYLLLGISYGLDILSLSIPALDSIISFTVYMKYIGAICLLFSKGILNYGLIILTAIQLLYSALRGGVFIDFFMWSTFLFFFASLKFGFSVWLRASFFLIAGPVLFMVQSVKDDYRDATWENRRESGIQTFNEIAKQEVDRSKNTPFLKTDGVVKTVGRLTQGWHLSLAMKWVPGHKAFTNGNEMLGDVVGAILPRILFSGKKLVATQDKFFMYTGYKLRKSTSMTIGVLGDFYINFGKTGSFIMLFIFGASASLFLNYFIKRFVLTDPLNIIWIPFMFSYFVRANNDFYMVFNCMVKGFLIFLFVNFSRKQLWVTHRQKSLAPQ